MARTPTADQEFDSAEAVFAFDAHLRVRAWNKPAEELTGIPADKAVGRRCWQVLRGVGADGERFCRPGCSYARLLLQGRPPPSCDMVIDTPSGPSPVSLSVIKISGGEQPLFLHLMKRHDGVHLDGARQLSPRQVEVAELLCQGLRATEIAARLGLAELTVRNHLREIRSRLGCHSQLEVVAKLSRRQLA